MSMSTGLPTYEQLFGDLDFKKGDEARSIYSPAAYLTDLLQLLDDYFENADIDDRRADIKGILLNAENSFNQTPYLDIVNRVLEHRIGPKVYDDLRMARYPFNMPFDLAHERAKLYLAFMELNPQDLFRQFLTRHDGNSREKIAREVLGLPVQAYRNIVMPGSQSEVAAYYGLSNTNEFIFPFKVERFLQITGLSGVELRELLFQQLSETSTNPSGRAERSEAGRFFIHHGLGGYADLDANEEHIIWLEASEESPFEAWQWFERVNRFVRLAQRTGLSFTDLDCILRNCCDNTLGHDQLGTIALVRHLHKTYELPIDVVCSLISGSMNTLGQGNEKEPQDLFNRVYNGRFAAIHKTYFLPEKDAHKPSAYKDFSPVDGAGDLLAPEQKNLRLRLQQALQIGKKDLFTIVNAFRERAEAIKRTSILSGPLNHASLSLLFRVSQLMGTLDISAQDLVDVLGILSKDPSLRKSRQFPLLMEDMASAGFLPAQNGFDILEKGSVADTQWLVQMLFAVVKWMQEYDFSGEELRQIMLGALRDEKAAAAAQEQQIAFLENLYRQFLPVMFGSQHLMADDEDDARTARVLHAALSNSANVAPRDKRILQVNAESVYHEAYEALSQIVQISPEDFTGLGLSEALLAKLHNNLILKNYLSPEGVLNEDRFPARAEDFVAATDFSAQRRPLFDILQKLYLQELEDLPADDIDAEFSEEDEGAEETAVTANNNISEVSFSVFLSDLDELNLSAEVKAELYDNLIFNGHIEETGDVRQPDFFADAQNADFFEVNVKIGAHGASIYSKIKERTGRFLLEPLRLNEETFEDLGLNEREIAQLVENLQFNGYIDKEKVFADKAALLAASAADFNLALVFYPKRHKILNALQAAIGQFKEKFYLFKPEDFADTADQIMAQAVHDAMAADYFPDGKLNAERYAFFWQEENRQSFELDLLLPEQHINAVFEAMKNLAATVQQYQISPAAMTEIGLEPDEQIELVEVLQNAGWLNDCNQIPEAHLPYFLNVNNALVFQLEDYTDYNKDIFFLLNAAAVKTDEKLQATVAQLTDLSAQQQQVVLDALAEVLGIEAEVTNVLAREILGSESHLVADIVLPMLSVVDSLERVTQTPENNKFELAYRRMHQFARLASKLGLSKEETEVVFHDQTLVEKFPEPLVLPDGFHSFDALLELRDEEIEINDVTYSHLIYLFKNNLYWGYDALTYNLVVQPSQLSRLSEHFAKFGQVDAAFTDHQNRAWVISGGQYFNREFGKKTWKRQERDWGAVQNNFDNPERIDASFMDNEGKTYLFSGGQYVRYSHGYDHVDEGYPKSIKGNWRNELSDIALPTAFYESIDASFQSTEGVAYLFKGDNFVSSEDFSKEQPIRTSWGKVKNNFAEANKLDAACAYGGKAYLFAGNQVMAYADSLENNAVKGMDGSPMSLETYLPGLPDIFDNGADAVFCQDEKGAVMHLFKDEQYLRYQRTATGKPPTKLLAENTKAKWGKVTNHLAETGIVDAAFVGLDGKTYLFSGDQYFRYSGYNYTEVDEGFPRSIRHDWGGLLRVDAAFILDGKTYLFGSSESGAGQYVQYSTRDYRIPDENYPQPVGDNWWNLPARLTQAGFGTPDAVFVGHDGKAYLFKGSRFISFNHLERWWSDPLSLSEHWDSIPFPSVSAAFSGKDGKTYIFTAGEVQKPEGVAKSAAKPTEPQFVRYSDRQYNKIDDRYPKSTKQHWGKIVNNIAKTGKVDATLVLESRVIPEGGTEANAQTFRHTYLFSGNQFFRYTDADFSKGAIPTVDQGYPRYIATSLKNEPRFQNLHVSLETGVDAAFADQRNVYLFKDDKWHVVSESLHKAYPSAATAAAQCVFLDGGQVFLEKAGQWQKVDSLESALPSFVPALPPSLRDVPVEFAEFRQNLDAVLHGTDGNTYLFKGAKCYNALLERAYPLNEEWGRSKNNIYFDNRVDAAFVGRDGKTYLFSGDQFVSYTPDKKTGAIFPSLTDGNPKPIAAHWGGLSEIKLAFVKGDKTYLFEKPDASGNMRYQCYSGTDYSKPDYEYPKTTDAKWSNLAEPWAQIPDVYVEEGFDSVDAVLFEDDNMFLIKGRDFVQFNEKSAHWSYPKPLDRTWRDMPFNETNFETIVTAFTGPDGNHYFFSDEAFVVYQSGLLVPQNGKIINPVRATWGLSDNDFVRENRIDAAFVDGEGFTYLFSGDQYVRYARGNYRFIDEGYPRDIVGNLRKEKPFANLPESFDEEMEKMLKDKQSIGGVIANGRNVYLFGKEGFQVVSNKAAASYPLDALGKIRNNIEQNNRVDAAFVSKEGKTYLFSGDQYFRYSDAPYMFVDEGFPRAIAGNLAAELSLPGFPAQFDYGLDTVFTGADGQVYFFKDKNYYAPGKGEKPIAGKWGKVKNLFAESAGLDAIFHAPDGKVYAFKNGQYTRYSNSENEFADEGFPLSIKDNWGNLPVSFEAGIDGAFVFEGRTYFLKGDEYVRYSRRDYRAIDPIYPQQFVNRFGPWADFLLGDLRAISRYKRMQDEHSGGDYSLTNLLHPAIVQNDPYKALSELFDWDIDEIKWLKRNQAFLPPSKFFEVTFDLEAVLKMAEIFALCGKMGQAPSVVYAEVWKNWFENGQLAEAASALYRFLGEMNSEKDWAVLSKQLHDAENVLKRDALLPYSIVRINQANAGNGSKIPQLRDARDLYEMLLIDVEMGSCGNTSVILEATAAIQLYFHRYFVNLEEVDLTGNEDEKTRAQLKKWWQWMKNYRVWEANRKVFLYPENFIRPELRDTKTPAFKTLEEDLLQNEVTDEAVLRVYKKYLDEYTEVSRLKIAGGYVYDDPEVLDDKQLVLFGHTKAEPPRYYYRTARFVGGNTDAVQWEAWRPFNNMIDAKRVHPVFAFGRIFVFWGKLEERLKDSSKTVIVNEGSNYSSESEKEYEIKIFFSFYNLNKEWASPQLLDTKIVESYKITDFELFVENSNLLENQKHENIIVNCAYGWKPVMSKEASAELAQIEANINTLKSWGNSLGSTFFAQAIADLEKHLADARAYYNTVTQTSAAYSLTPELYTVELQNKPVFSNQGLQVFQSIFASTEKISIKREVQLSTYENSTDGPWFSFDHKGGSFLVKPSVPKITVHPQKVADNPAFPNWANLDAAFELGTERFFFKNNVYVTSQKPGTELPIDARWGKQNPGPVVVRKDTALVDGNLTFFFNGNECLIFTGNKYELSARSGPFTLQQLALLPNQTAPHFGAMLAAGWTGFDAGVRMPNGNLLFFNGTSYMLNGGIASETVKNRWGKLKANSFTDPARSKVVAAFSLNNDVYLFNNEEFVKYTGGQLDHIAPEYPKPSNLAGLLDDLGVAMTAAKRNEYKTLKIEGAYTKDGKIFIHHHPGRGFEINPVAKTVSEANTNPNMFEVAYVNEQGAVVKQTEGQTTVDAAFTQGGNLYLFKGKKYHQQSTIPAAFPTISDATWASKPNISDRWGLAETIDRVDSAFIRDGKLFLTKGNLYARYSGSNLDSMDDGYPKQLSTNSENLPKLDRLDAAFVGNDGKTYFFKDTKFRTSDNLNAEQNTKPLWESVAFSIAEKGVDAAYIRDKKLFLLSGKMFFRYTISPLGTVGEFADAGYPKPMPAEIDAAFVQNDLVYLFAKDQYYKLSGTAEPDVLPAPKKVKGNWGNIPGLFQNGFEATLNTSGKLYLFKAGQYLEYETSDGKATPYEIDSARFDIIRLTTGTGYKLNERLFSGGLPKLLALETQELDEVPSFSDKANSSAPTMIQVAPNKVNILPVSDHLDFYSANGPYYWEIFFHAPFLLAQYFNSNQKFEAAKTWYEYIYDPTQKSDFWKYLPFREAYLANADLKPRAYTDAEIRAYLDDPFDPHTIAALRTVAYRKAIVMSYIDNLLDWGDMLFRQYTMESINEARMLYVLAYDMLGDKPENLGVKKLPEQNTNYRGLLNLIKNAAQNKALLALENALDAHTASSAKLAAGTVHDTILTHSVYFFSPENTQFIEYWDRVEDRLYKIRHCLNIMGEAQPLPLFQPPIDPMALVQAAAGGGGFEAALASLGVSVPHYRFAFMFDKAQQLVQKLNELSSELLSALEKKDGEAFSILQNRHEGIIHGMTRSIRVANIEEAKKNIDSLKESLSNARLRETRYGQWINGGLNSLESTQLGLIIAGASLQGASAIIKVASGIAHLFPKSSFGVFMFGVTTGGDHVGKSLESFAEALETGGEALSMGGEAAGIKAQNERSNQDWGLQKDMAASDARQIEAQIAGAEFQLQIAQREAEILEKEIEQNGAVATFYKEKFTNEQLYLWMAGKLSGLFFQCYKLAYDMAKYAERAFQFERGIKESEVNYIQPTYWDSRRKGLLVGQSLAYDLDRMEKAFIETDARRLEITKPVSLLELDPLAFLQLKSRGRCEFSLTEAMYDYDFQGHYNRQIKTISISFEGMEDQVVNATLTQLSHKTVLEPDTKAVKFLLNPKDQPPLSIRSDWRPNQQIALSYVDVEDREKNNGLFELRFDSERYLPFEGTGAVSDWRLELNGKRGSYDLSQLTNVVIQVKYTALQGGQVFGQAVKGLLKPYLTGVMFNVAETFSDQWSEFLESDSKDLELSFTREMFPNMSSNKITGIFARFDLSAPGSVSMVVNGDSDMTLKDGKYIDTSGLSISNKGTALTFNVKGNKALLSNISLVMGYKAQV